MKNGDGPDRATCQCVAVCACVCVILVAQQHDECDGVCVASMADGGE